VATRRSTDLTMSRLVMEHILQRCPIGVGFSSERKLIRPIIIILVCISLSTQSSEKRISVLEYILTDNSLRVYARNAEQYIFSLVNDKDTYFIDYCRAHSLYTAHKYKTHH